MASISKVQIGNFALSNVGAGSTIESFTEDSAEAKEIDLWYEWSRLVVLEKFDWSFARVRRVLTPHADAPPEGLWGFRYQYPADAVRIRRLVNPLGPKADVIPMDIELSLDGLTKTILTNLSAASAVYTLDLNTTSLFSPHFVDAFAARLGAQIAFALTAKRSVRGDLITLFNSLIIEAPAHDANETFQGPPRDADWIEFREGASGSADGDPTIIR